MRKLCINKNTNKTINRIKIVQLIFLNNTGIIGILL